MAFQDLAGSGAIDFGTGLSTAMAVFLAWAIARELDPDDPRSAALAMAFTLAIALLSEVAAAGAALVLLATRLIVGSVGRRLKPADYVVLVGAAAFAGTRPELWPAAALLAAGLLLAHPTGSKLASLAAATGAFYVAFAWSAAPETNLHLEALAVVAFAVLASLASVPPATVASRADSGLYVISTNRVALARVATGAVAAASVVLTTGSLPTVAPLLAVMAAIPIVSLFKMGPGDVRDGAEQTREVSEKVGSTA